MTISSLFNSDFRSSFANYCRHDTICFHNSFAFLDYSDITEQHSTQWLIPKPRILYELRIYEKDVDIKRHSLFFKSPHSGGGIRSAIKYFSPRAMKRLRFNIRNIPSLSHWIVLTYPKNYPVDGDIVTKHLYAIRRFISAKGRGGIWIKEFQKRGAIHINILLNGGFDIDLLQKQWAKIVGANDPVHEKYGVWMQPIKNIDKVVGYLSKWRSKSVPANFSNVGRIWGRFGGVKPTVNCIQWGSADEMLPVFYKCLSKENTRRAKLGFAPRQYSGIWSFTSYDSAHIALKLIRPSKSTPSKTTQVFHLVKSLVLISILKMSIILFIVHYKLFWLKWRNTLLPF